MKRIISLIILTIFVGFSNASADDNIGTKDNNGLLPKPPMMSGTGSEMRRPPMMSGTGSEMRRPPMMSGTGSEMRRPPMMSGTGSEMRRPPMMSGTGSEMRRPPMMSGTGSEMRAKYNQKYTQKYGKMISQLDEAKVKILIEKIDALISNVNSGDKSDEEKAKLTVMLEALKDIANKRLDDLKTETDLNLDSLFQ